MNIVAQIEASLNGDVLENEAVVEAQEVVATATATVAAKTILLADANTALQEAEDAGEDTTDEQAAVDSAQTAKDEADEALELATTTLTDAQSNASSADTLELIAQLKPTDYSMISNDTMRKIMTAQGREILFCDGENVISNSAMELVTPSEVDVTPVGK